MNLIDRIRAVREAGMVERCHTIPHNLSYTNARHTYGVVCLIRLLWPEATHLLDFALFHDTPERWTGDVPGQVMAANPGLRGTLKLEDMRISRGLELPSEHALDPYDMARFKAADRLDFWLWTWEEEAMGNRMVLNARETSTRMLLADPTTPKEVLDFMGDYQQEGWKRLPEVLA